MAAGENLHYWDGGLRQYARTVPQRFFSSEELQVSYGLTASEIRDHVFRGANETWRLSAAAVVSAAIRSR